MSTKWFFILKFKIKNLYQDVQKHLSELSFVLSPRFIVYLGLLSLLPFLCLGFYFSILYGKQREVERGICRLEEKTKFLFQNKEKQEQFIHTFGLSDPQFLQKYVEPIELLSRDIAVLSEVVERGGQNVYKPILERLAFLKSDQNQIRFIKKEEKKTPHYQETIYCLAHPVEVDVQDLRQLLSLIEGVKIDGFLPNPSRPQLIIKKIDLKLKDDGSEHREYILDLELIQRGCHEEHSL